MPQDVVCSPRVACFISTDPAVLTNSCSAPVVAAADPTSPTPATILLNPPATGGPVEKYIVKLCLQPAGTPCITKECRTITCPVASLRPGATYKVTAEAVIDGQKVPAANSLPLVMPDAGAITLTSAVDTSSTTGEAVAQAPAGVKITKVRGREAVQAWWWCACAGGASAVSRHAQVLTSAVLPAPASSVQYTFTATPTLGGDPVTWSGATSKATFTGLTPATQASYWHRCPLRLTQPPCMPCRLIWAGALSCRLWLPPQNLPFIVPHPPPLQYDVVVVGILSTGGTTPPSNTLSFVTPAAG